MTGLGPMKADKVEYEIIASRFFDPVELLEFVRGKRTSVLAKPKYVARRVK